VVVEPVETTISFFPIAGVSMLRQAQQPQAQQLLQETQRQFYLKSISNYKYLAI